MQHLDSITRDTSFDHLPPSAQPKRVLLIATTKHEAERIKTYVDALRIYSGAAVDVVQPTQHFLDQFPKAKNDAGYQFESLIKRYDGFVLSGGRPNVTPELYGEKPEYDDSPHDLPRDLLSLGIVQQSPSSKAILGICLGMQHIAVAFGAKLRKVEEHGPPDKDNAYGPAHPLKIKGGTILHALQSTAGEIFGRNLIGEFAARIANKFTGKEKVTINSVHWRAIDEASITSINPAKHDIHVIARAPDDTIEAIHIDGTNIIGVQNHPEKDVATNDHSRKLFAAFGLMLNHKLDLRDCSQFKSFMTRYLRRRQIARHAQQQHLTATRG